MKFYIEKMETLKFRGPAIQEENQEVKIRRITSVKIGECGISSL
jgi:hypothetical protein